MGTRIISFIAISILTLSVNAALADSMGGMQTSNSTSATQENMAGMAMTQMSYQVTAANSTYLVTIGSNSQVPAGVTFNAEQKSLSFGVSGLSTRDLSHYEVTIPSALLNGRFTASVGGAQLKIIPVPNATSTTIHINISGPFVKSNGVNDSSTVILVGTQAVPEFPTGLVLVLPIVLAASIAITRGTRAFRLTS